MMNKSSIICLIVVSFLILLGQFPVASAEEISSEARWGLSLWRNALTVYDEMASSKYLISKDDYVLCFDCYVFSIKQKELFDLFGMASVKIGEETSFNVDLGGDDLSYAFTDNPFIGFCGLLRFRLFENAKLDVSVEMNYGLLNNLIYFRKTVGYVYGDKGSGLWDSTEEKARLVYRYHDFFPFVGLSIYQLYYKVAITDWPAPLSSGYKKDIADSVTQGSCFAGLEYVLEEVAILGFSYNIPSNKSLLAGYQIYAKYLF